LRRPVISAVGNLLIPGELYLIIVMGNTTFSVYEAARELGCTSQWVRVLLAEGRLEGAQKVDGEWQIPAAEIEKRKQRQEAVSA
jgi:hypothetical protein